jgi:hypothetical protein
MTQIVASANRWQLGCIAFNGKVDSYNGNCWRQQNFSIAASFPRIWLVLGPKLVHWCRKGRVSRNRLDKFHIQSDSASLRLQSGYARRTGQTVYFTLALYRQYLKFSLGLSSDGIVMALSVGRSDGPFLPQQLQRYC